MGISPLLYTDLDGITIAGRRFFPPGWVRSCTNRRGGQIGEDFFPTRQKPPAAVARWTRLRAQPPVNAPKTQAYLVYLRTCIHSRMMQAGQGFFCPARRKTAGILGVLQGFLTQQDRKRLGLTASDGYEYRFSSFWGKDRRKIYRQDACGGYWYSFLEPVFITG